MSGIRTHEVRNLPILFSIASTSLMKDEKYFCLHRDSTRRPLRLEATTLTPIPQRLLVSYWTEVTPVTLVLMLI